MKILVNSKMFWNNMVMIDRTKSIFRNLQSKFRLLMKRLKILWTNHPSFKKSYRSVKCFSWMKINMIKYSKFLTWRFHMLTFRILMILTLILTRQWLARNYGIGCLRPWVGSSSTNNIGKKAKSLSQSEMKTTMKWWTPMITLLMKIIFINWSNWTRPKLVKRQIVVLSHFSTERTSNFPCQDRIVFIFKYK